MVKYWGLPLHHGYQKEAFSIHVIDSFLPGLERL
jgi:hypothetical protein